MPLFKKQIETGGPVTVTHPRHHPVLYDHSRGGVAWCCRPGVYAKGGEIFVLDMGEPVKIDTLARNLIRLSGLRAGRGHPH